MDKILLELTPQELDIVVQGLLELQGKIMLSVLRNIDTQVTAQVKK